eukprot:3882279-Amphidinium_carterae.1
MKTSAKGVRFEFMSFGPEQYTHTLNLAATIVKEIRMPQRPYGVWRSSGGAQRNPTQGTSPIPETVCEAWNSLKKSATTGFNTSSNANVLGASTAEHVKSMYSDTIQS